MSTRLPSVSIRMESCSDRSINRRKPKCEKRAPAFFAREVMTSWLPVTTRTSVTGSATVFLLDIASRSSWLLERAIETRVRTSSRSECRRMGPATSIELSRASWLMTLTGAFLEWASRLASSARAAALISRASRSITSPKIQISFSEY